MRDGYRCWKARLVRRTSEYNCVKTDGVYQAGQATNLLTLETLSLG